MATLLASFPIQRTARQSQFGQSLESSQKYQVPKAPSLCCSTQCLCLGRRSLQKWQPSLPGPEGRCRKLTSCDCTVRTSCSSWSGVKAASLLSRLRRSLGACKYFSPVLPVFQPSPASTAQWQPACAVTYWFITSLMKDLCYITNSFLPGAGCQQKSRIKRKKREEMCRDKLSSKARKITGLEVPQCSKLLEKETRQKPRGKGDTPGDMESSAPTKVMAGSPEPCCFHATV